MNRQATDAPLARGTGRRRVRGGCLAEPHKPRLTDWERLLVLVVVVGCVTTIGMSIAVTAVLSGWGADTVQWAEAPSPDGSRTVIVYYQSGVGLWDKGSLRVKLADNREGEEPREIASFTVTALDFPEGEPLVEWTSKSTVRVGTHRIPIQAGQ